MNYITINNLDDFQELLNVDILITGDISRQQEEKEYNTWHISFDSTFIKNLTFIDMSNLLNQLIKQRSQQVSQANNGPATFYLWYDEQSFNLGFDVLSGINIKLPFYCKVNIQHTPINLLKKLLQDTQSGSNYLSWENLTILNPGDPGFDDDDDEDDKILEKMIIEVFVTTLPQSNISAFFQKLIS